MSNIIKVPHTVTFLAEINTDTIPANLLPALLAMPEEHLIDMCKMATLEAIKVTGLIEKANENASGWAQVSLAE